ncbi:MAG: FAD binding domain-containing protein [Microbacteriaceae bacterium]
MILDRFEYLCPSNIDEVVTAITTEDEVAIISGGTWVVPQMGHHVRRPKIVVDLQCAGLSGISENDDTITVGPKTTYSQLISAAHTPPLLRTMASGITGGVQIRNKGTIGGSACYANPASDVPGAIVALEASMVLRSERGQRVIAATEFFVDALETALEPGEVLEAILIPGTAAKARFSYQKFRTVTGSFPIVTAACLADANDLVTRVVIGGAAVRPITIELEGNESDQEVADLTRSRIDQPWSDVLANANFRRHTAGVMAQRAVRAVRHDTDGGER